MKKKIYLKQKKRYMKQCFGTSQKLRLSVFRSNNHIYAQLINDEIGHTLVASSTRNKTIKFFSNLSKKDIATKVGEDLALKAKEKEINFVVFDRAFRPYAGKIRKLAEGARNKGLCF